MNISLALLHALKEHGAQEIFGIPGDFALPFFKEIEESKILPLSTLSHEPGMGFAADAAGVGACIRKSDLISSHIEMSLGSTVTAFLLG